MMNGKTVLITGGTDGIGAAAALELGRLGARVIIVGRSGQKAEALIAKSRDLHIKGSIEAITSDFSLMKHALQAARQVAERVSRLDVVIHCVGILIAHAEYSPEGIEKDFAVSYLSRFVCTEELFAKGLLTPGTRMINVAASSPKIPAFVQMEFNDLKAVEARTGMKSHGQAQLANDLYTAVAAKRYGIVSVGYGPGSVDTNIRRELPPLIIGLLKPFFYFSTRKPEQVAAQFVSILSETELENGKSYYYTKKGRFPAADFITSEKRQQELTSTSVVLAKKALMA